MSKRAQITPIRKQYLEIKKQYPDAILFFRLGDFYETFDEDAHVTSIVLDIVLTSRKVGKGTRIPMAGIPFHAAENYLGRLLARGFHVAICEQVGKDPVNGLMHRKVVRVITPGTVLEEGLLPGDENNYLASVVILGSKTGIAYVDITTGEFLVSQLEGKDIIGDLRAELHRVKPTELLVPADGDLLGEFPGFITRRPSWHYEIDRAKNVLLKHYEVASLEGYGIGGMPLAIAAAGALIQYLSDTQTSALQHLQEITAYTLSEFMTLDSATRRNLEITETIRGGQSAGSLMGMIDKTVTPMGKRILRQWVSKPLLDVDEIRKRQKVVNFFYQDGLLRSELQKNLTKIGDLERLTYRLVNATAQPRDLVALRGILQLLPQIDELIPTDSDELSEIIRDFDVLADELVFLESAITEEPPATLGNIGIVSTGFSAELDGVIESSRHAREWIANLENVERHKTGIKSLKVGYNKIFGYYIEVTKANESMVPEHFIRKQTLVNAERYITPEMKEYESLVLNAEERIKELERQLFYTICSRLTESAQRILRVARVLAQLDVLISLAEAAVINGYVCPEVVDEDVLVIESGRHPVVERSLAAGQYIPNDTIFETGERIRIITGPNMSGKSTFLRQVALIVLLAQIGSFVPAESAKIGLVDRIFTRIGAQDEIHAGQSTFMVEMVEVANILHNATERSLVILDEVGRGTSTYDGVSIAWATVEYIHNHPRLRSKTLFATHYHELTRLAEMLPGVKNYNVAVSEIDGEVIFLRKIVPGGADRSYGIYVAKIAGVPRPVVQRAGEIMDQLEQSSGTVEKNEAVSVNQLSLFPETNPLLDEIDELDLNALSPIEALNKLYEWRKRFGRKDK